MKFFDLLTTIKLLKPNNNSVNLTNLVNSTIQNNEQILENSIKLMDKIKKLKKENKTLKKELRDSINATDLQVLLLSLRNCSNCANSTNGAMACSNCVDVVSDWISDNDVINELLKK